MENSTLWIVAGALLGVFGFLGGILFRKLLAESKLGSVQEKTRRLLAESEREAENKIKEASIEAKEIVLRARSEFEQETKQRRADLQKMEQRLIQKEEMLERKMDLLDHKEKDFINRERKIQEREARISHQERKSQSILEEQIRKLEQISGLTSQQAKDELVTKLVDEARVEAADKVKRVEEETRELASRKAREILSLAMQRYAADHVAETSVSVVDLPNDEMKGRIIGREGRNIRALEMATGVDLIIDDTPEAVIISCFDPIRREVCRQALQRLVADGRIHPGRIEEVVNKIKKEIENGFREDGEQAVFELGLTGIHVELVKLLGRLKFRTSYSQNVLQHSKEVAHLCGLMAAELNLDPKLAKRAGLFHDIGKAVDQQMEGSHIQVGIEMAKRYGEPPEVINAIASHHDDVEATCIEAVLVDAADALSAARPGARREMLESYVKRLAKLEEIGESFKGVAKTYAIQAGREMRVMVEPEQIKDAEALFLAKDIAKKIKQEMAFPGEIKVTVIREVRAVEYAR